MTQNQRITTDELNRIAETICDHYCKYSDLLQKVTSQQAVHLIQTIHCEDCSLNRIVR